MEDKVICYCLDLKESDIVEAINNGAKTLEEIQDATGAGTACGSCIGDIADIMAKNIK
ncbi:MAG: (2Fe-2S)-binding protein [Sarcina sp.]